MARPLGLLGGALVGYLTRLRFPVLFAVTTALFALDLFVPDVIPFADEFLLGLGAALLGSWRKRKVATRDVSDAPA